MADEPSLLRGQLSLGKHISGLLASGGVHVEVLEEDLGAAGGRSAVLAVVDTLDVDGRGHGSVRVSEGSKPVQHFTPRRKRSNWCERNLIRCRRLVETGEMTPARLAVAPDLDPSLFVFEDWVLNAIEADEKAWANYCSFPETYRRIRVDYIQHYRQTGREEQAQSALQRFIKDCHAGRMQPGWDDLGRLL